MDPEQLSPQLEDESLTCDACGRIVDEDDIVCCDNSDCDAKYCPDCAAAELDDFQLCSSCGGW